MTADSFASLPLRTTELAQCVGCRGVAIILEHHYWFLPFEILGVRSQNSDKPGCVVPFLNFMDTFTFWWASNKCIF